ncbi:MAG: hypothetical protein ACKVOK_09895 [Flavobacteriales bacterium]
MKSTLVPVYIVLATLFMSCESTPATETNIQNAKWLEVEGSGFQIKIPDYLGLINPELNPDAIFTYGNESMEVYTMVIEEEVESVNAAFLESGQIIYQNGLSGYVNFVKDNMVNEADTVFFISPIREEKNGEIISQSFEIESDVDSLELFRALRIMEVNSKYYQFHTWTLLKQKDQYKDILFQILKSFEPKDAEPAN